VQVLMLVCFFPLGRLRFSPFSLFCAQTCSNVRLFTCSTPSFPSYSGATGFETYCKATTNQHFFGCVSSNNGGDISAVVTTSTDRFRRCLEADEVEFTQPRVDASSSLQAAQNIADLFGNLDNITVGWLDLGCLEWGD
jgi:hypothetical protein